MFGEIAWIIVVMLLVALAAFAPLGYFIYLYINKNSEPFHDADTAHEPGLEAKVVGLVDKLIAKLKGGSKGE